MSSSPDELEPEGEPPRPDEQVRLRAGLTEAYAHLLGRAANLCRGLREPRPDPRDVVSQVTVQLLRRYRDEEVDDVRRLAFTALARVVCDVARRYKFDAGPTDEAPVTELAEGPGTTVLLSQIWERIEPRERCVLLRIHVEHTAVIAAFQACGWETRSPHFEHKKLLDRIRDLVEEPSP
jgi:DNA-directed RNA polymerase specialized sigma24 family protein